MRAGLINRGLSQLCDTTSSFLPTLHLTLQGFYTRGLKESAQLCQVVFFQWHWYPPCFMGKYFANIVLVHHHCVPQRTLQTQILRTRAINQHMTHLKENQELYSDNVMFSRSSLGHHPFPNKTLISSPAAG